MAFTTIPGVGKLRASTLSALITEVRPTHVRKSTDEIVSNSVTLQNDDELVLPVEANLIYRVEWDIIYQAGTVADYKFAFTYPAGATLVGVCVLYNVSGTVAFAAGTFTSGAGISAGGLGIGTNAGMQGRATLVMGSTAGNIQYQFAQTSAVVENTTTVAGSLLLLNRLS